MRMNFSCRNFLNTPRAPGHPGKIPGTSQIPLFETQGRRTFEGEHELFGHHPFAWKTPTPSGGLRTQKVNPCALFLLPEKGPESSPELHHENRHRTSLPHFLCPRKGHMQRGSCSCKAAKGVFLPSKCLLESPFLEPLLRTLLRTLPINLHCVPPRPSLGSQHPSHLM